MEIAESSPSLRALSLRLTGHSHTECYKWNGPSASSQATLELTLVYTDHLSPLGQSERIGVPFSGSLSPIQSLHEAESLNHLKRKCAMHCMSSKSAIEMSIQYVLAAAGLFYEILWYWVGIFECHCFKNKPRTNCGLSFTLPTTAGLSCLSLIYGSPVSESTRLVAGSWHPHSLLYVLQNINAICYILYGSCLPYIDSHSPLLVKQ